MGLTVGFAVWFFLNPRLRSKLYQFSLRVAEKSLIFARRSLDDFGERLLLAVQIGLEEAKKKEAELRQKIEVSNAGMEKR